MPGPETHGRLLLIVNALDMPGLDPRAIEPPVALGEYYLRYRVSDDGARTWLFDELYPTADADYYAFINAARRALRANYLIDGNKVPDRTAITLAAKEYPITFEAIRSGMVRGPERIITMNSGVYGWPNDRRLHLVYKFDNRGALVAHDFLTTVDGAGARTELAFGKNESAVIEPTPMSIEMKTPVNTRVVQYDAKGIKVLLNAKDEAVMVVGDGVFSIQPNDAYRTTIGGVTTTVTEKDGKLTVPLKLNGQIEVMMEPVGKHP